jgi:drug/metabolite transporter (DMT)-like permease
MLRFFSATLWSGLAVILMGKVGSLWLVGPSEASRLVFIAFTTGLVAMFLYYHGLKTTEAKVSTILELAFPLLAVFVDMFLYKTFLSPSQYIAAVILLFAMYRVGKLQKAVKVTYLKKK